MKIILLGGPGAGKGTQSQKLSDHLHIPQISGGDLLREEVTTGSPLGRRVAEYIMVGKFVPDPLIIRIIENRIQAEDCANGFILDGFPRTIGQAQKLKKITDIDAVVFITVSPELVHERLAARTQCRNCHAVFHKRFNPPKKKGVCDHCGGELYTRPDDNKSTIEKRIGIYELQTAPIEKYYLKEGVLRKVDGCGDIQDIFEEILHSLGYVKFKDYFPLDHEEGYRGEKKC